LVLRELFKPCCLLLNFFLPFLFCDTVFLSYAFLFGNPIFLSNSFLFGNPVFLSHAFFFCDTIFFSNATILGSPSLILNPALLLLLSLFGKLIFQLTSYLGFLLLLANLDGYLEFFLVNFG
jgi:hypothetical protein